MGSDRLSLFKRYMERKCKEYFHKHLKEYIAQIKISNKVGKEKAKYMVEIVDPDMEEFSSTYYLKTSKEAEELFKLEAENGKKLELWKLLKRT